jgi:hypothetical protein
MEEIPQLKTLFSVNLWIVALKISSDFDPKFVFSLFQHYLGLKVTMLKNRNNLFLWDLYVVVISSNYTHCDEMCAESLKGFLHSCNPARTTKIFETYLV